MKYLDTKDKTGPSKAIEKGWAGNQTNQQWNTNNKFQTWNKSLSKNKSSVNII